MTRIPCTSLVRHIAENKPSLGLAEEHVQILAREILRLRDFIRNQHLHFQEAEDYDTFTGYIEIDAAEISSWEEDPDYLRAKIEYERKEAQSKT